MTAIHEMPDQSEDMFERVRSHIRNSSVPEAFTLEYEVGKNDFLKYVKVQVAPLVPRHWFDSKRFPTNIRAEEVLRAEQKKWGTGTDSVPLIMFTPRGTTEFTVRWAMVRPEDFRKSPEELLETIKRMEKIAEVQDEMKLYVTSLQFVYAAVTGERAPGDDAPPPLKVLPARSTI